jgi:CHASE3 domain sensor protein
MKISHSLLTSQAFASVALIAVVLVFNAIAVHRNAVSLHDTDALAVQSQEVLAQSEQIFMRLVEAESGVRGFSITGDDSHLEIYRLVNDSLSDQLKALRASVADNPFLLAKCRVIEDEAKARMELLRLVVLARSDDGFDAARVVVEAGDGKLAMDRIRESVKNLEVESKGMLHERIANADRQLSTILFVNVAGVCLGLLISCISWVLIDRQVRKCREAKTIADAERENLLVTLKSIGNAVVVTDSD